MFGVVCIKPLSAPPLDRIMYSVHAPPVVGAAAGVGIQYGLGMTPQTKTSELCHILTDACVFIPGVPGPVRKGILIDII